MLYSDQTTCRELLYVKMKAHPAWGRKEKMDCLYQSIRGGKVSDCSLWSGNQMKTTTL